MEALPGVERCLRSCTGPHPDLDLMSGHSTQIDQALCLRLACELYVNKKMTASAIPYFLGWVAHTQACFISVLLFCVYTTTTTALRRLEYKATHLVCFAHLSHLPGSHRVLSLRLLISV